MNAITVLGGGPAGVVCALGLRKLGYEVVLVAKKRPFDALEGFSQRTIEGLKQAGCEKALNTITIKAKRDALWNNVKSDKNYEFIVERSFFDEALLLDAKKAGVQIIKGSATIINLESLSLKVKRKSGNQLIKASFIVDARGRMSPRSIQKKSKETSSFLVSYKKTNKVTKTSLSTCKYGWIWKASFLENKNYLQLTSDNIDAREKLDSIIGDDVKELLKDDYKITVRDASSYISKSIISNKFIKIGDAACAIDPLSGNGVFQALSTALISPYVIHTLLTSTASNKSAAKSFFKNRVDDIFYRYTRMGRDFYSLEKQFDTLFWRQRASWPDLEKYDKNSNINEVKIEKKAILDAPLIKAHEVVVTKNAPMGIWRLGRINLVYIVKELLLLQKDKREFFLQKLVKNLDLIKKERLFLVQWCKENYLF